MLIEISPHKTFNFVINLLSCFKNKLFANLKNGPNVSRFSLSFHANKTTINLSTDRKIKLQASSSQQTFLKKKLINLTMFFNESRFFLKWISSDLQNGKQR